MTVIDNKVEKYKSKLGKSTQVLETTQKFDFKRVGDILQMAKQQREQSQTPSPAKSADINL